MFRYVILGVCISPYVKYFLFYDITFVLCAYSVPFIDFNVCTDVVGACEQRLGYDNDLRIDYVVVIYYYQLFFEEMMDIF